LNQEILDQINAIIPKENILGDEPMSRHTTFRTGGPADYFIRISSKDELSKLITVLKKENIDFFVTGNGSNLLVSDNGYHGVIISMSGLDTLQVDGNRILAGAGVLNSKVAQEALKHSLTGMEALAGIPGSVGGCLRMNAGAYGSEMKDVVESADIMFEDGHVETMSVDDMKLRYRGSRIGDEKLYVLGVTFTLFNGDKKAIEEAMADYAARRRDKQPLEFPSAGSTFKRPEGYFAGKLIQDAGLRGFAIGGAQVSDKHCGFVVNKGGATSKDVIDVIRHVQKTVLETSGVELDTEVILLGDFE
jgi:UDP-N-acetylmuramate dehydrogenase